ncbi:hypothetical protein H8790_12435 [Oscillibacter hominis]|uniref:Uncharacterized protein n=1 Tax=Oscillibacter hominis TaxID=2763056 RepID=A0A7G9B3U9_9FIRM|nr:hypothetical protein [Oscillibacter hominis]QNL44230.1 hypothetical protein H8790_12435 [Oscillibacter hominis]
MNAAWKEKKLWLGIAALAIALAAVVWCRFQHTFTTERWLSSPERRADLVDNLLGRYDLEGMSVHQVKALLGEETVYLTDSGAFLSYELGMEPGLISIDCAFLTLGLENDRVASVSVSTS